MKKKDDFEGQKMLVLPSKIIKELKNNQFTSDLYITDIGYFPKARYHYRKRKEGSLEYILLFCVEGRGWIEVDGKKATLNKNQYFIIPRNTPHRYAADHDAPWTIYWIHFAGNKTDHFVFPLGYPRTLKESANARFEDRKQLFEEIYYILDEGYSIDNLEYSSVLLVLLLGSLKYASQFGKATEIHQKDVISNAIYFMKENVERKLSVLEIASHCGLSVSHFCLIFKKKTSRSPLEYFTFIKMQKACTLLNFSTLKINRIAEGLGYDDPYYFTRVFKKVVGKSPSLYRQYTNS